jgi:hypothetical protein
MDYRKRVYQHLADYKVNVLGIRANGVWSGNEQEYSHILPIQDADLNIVPSIRASCLAYMRESRIHRHKDFHHLNSSQAFALNLFFPLLSYSAAHEPLLQALGLPAPAVSEWSFETVLDKKEGTNFDVLITLAGGTRVFIEVKLTESTFGSVKHSRVQEDRRTSIYLEHLRGKVQDSALDPDYFFKHYQLLRNLTYCSTSDVVLFVVPAQNTRVAEAAATFVNSTVAECMRNSVRVVHIEDLVADLVASDLPGPARTALDELLSKYPVQITG